MTKKKVVLIIIEIAAFFLCAIILAKILGSRLSAPAERIETFIGETKDIDAGGDIKEATADRDTVTVDKKGKTLTVIPNKTGRTKVTVSLKKNGSSLLSGFGNRKTYEVTVKENPVKGKVLSLSENIYGNSIAIMNVKNTSDYNLSNVSVDYTVNGGRITGAVADGTQTFTFLRAGETRYFAAVLDKQSTIDTEKSSIRISFLKAFQPERSDKNFNKKVSVSSDIEKALSSGSRYTKVTIKNNSKKDASVLVTFVYYDADGKVSNIWTDETIYPAGRKTANTYDVTFDKDRDKSVKAIYQVFEA